MVKLPSGLLDKIGKKEELVRFLTSSKHFNTFGVKPVAFLPNPEDRTTSVSRHGKEPIADLWTIGRAAAGTRTLHGAAFFLPSDVVAAGLVVEADEPPNRHAILRDWFWSDDEPEQRARQLSTAQALASSCGDPLLCT